jgi:hypothetical protein
MPKPPSFNTFDQDHITIEDWPAITESEPN